MMMLPLLNLSLYSVSMALLLGATEPQPTISKVIVFDNHDTLHVLKHFCIWEAAEKQEELLRQAEGSFYRKVGNIVFCELPPPGTESRSLAQRVLDDLHYDRTTDVYVFVSMTMFKISQCQALKDVLDAMKTAFPSGERKLFVIAQKDLLPVDIKAYGASTVHPNWPHENAELVAQDSRAVLQHQGSFIVQYLFATQYYAYAQQGASVFNQIAAVYYPNILSDEDGRDQRHYTEVTIHNDIIQHLERILHCESWTLAADDTIDQLEEYRLRMQIVCRSKLLHRKERWLQLKSVSFEEATFRLLVALIAAIKQGEHAVIYTLLQLQTPAIATKIRDLALGLIAIALVFGRIVTAKKLMAFVEEECNCRFPEFVLLNWTPPIMAKLLDAMLQHRKTNAALLLRVMLSDRSTMMYSENPTQETEPYLLAIRKFVDEVDTTQT